MILSMLYPAGQQFFDSDGDPVGAGKLYIYDNGTTNAASAYSDPNLSTGALSSPIVLDSAGRLTTNVYVADATQFTVVLDDSADAEIWSRDDTHGYDQGGALTLAEVTRVQATSTGAQVTGTILDLDSSSADSTVGVRSRNSQGGVTIQTRSSTGQLQVRQTTSLGADEDVWISADRDGATTIHHNGSAKVATASNGFLINGSSTVGIFSGTGTPEGAVTAGIGSMFMRTDGGAGTSLYVKESGTGNTGWAAM